MNEQEANFIRVLGFDPEASNVTQRRFPKNIKSPLETIADQFAIPWADLSGKFLDRFAKEETTLNPDFLFYVSKNPYNDVVAKRAYHTYDPSSADPFVESGTFTLFYPRYRKGERYWEKPKTRWTITRRVEGEKKSQMVVTQERTTLIAIDNGRQVSASYKDGQLESASISVDGIKGMKLDKDGKPFLGPIKLKHMIYHVDSIYNHYNVTAGDKMFPNAEDFTSIDDEENIYFQRRRNDKKVTDQVVIPKVVDLASFAEKIEWAELIDGIGSERVSLDQWKWVDPVDANGIKWKLLEYDDFGSLPRLFVPSNSSL